MARKGALGEIREFVYLDETAVESMLAAVDGEILVQTTRSSSRTREVSIGSTAKSDSEFGSAGISSGLKLGRTRGSEETRKSVAQSAFARFRSKNAHSFVLRRGVSMGWLARRRVQARAPKHLRKYGAGVEVVDLKRGHLLEIEVTLSAAEIFQVRTAINAVGDVVNSFPDFLPLEQREIFRTVRPLTALIDTLNADAIPVVAMLPNVELVTVEGNRWLVSTPGRTDASLELHAVTTPDWYWGDIGRTLFQNRRFTVLCRVVDPAIRVGPGASYVGAILNTVHPPLAAMVDDIGPMMMGALRKGTEQGAASLPDWVSSYSRRVAELLGDGAASPTFEGLESIDLRQAPIAKQLEYFAAIDQAVGVDDGDLQAQLTELRVQIRNEFGLWPWSEERKPATSSKRSSTSTARLEVELIAAYW